jgi:hypothetical protein
MQLLQQCGSSLGITQLAIPQPQSLGDAIHELLELRQLKQALLRYQEQTQGMYTLTNSTQDIFSTAVENIRSGTTSGTGVMALPPNQRKHGGFHKHTGDPGSKRPAPVGKSAGLRLTDKKRRRGNFFNNQYSLV